MKKILAAAAFLGVFALSGCFNTSSYTSAIGSYNFNEMDLVQLEEPYDGQPVAVIETTHGTIKAVLYPEYAPNTVSNFVNRVNEGYYDGKDIYGIIDKAYFMSGSFDETRLNGATDDGELIPNEYSVDLWPFKGAICAYNGKVGYGDSRFFVINEYELTEQDLAELRGYKNNEDGSQVIPEELINAFVEKGCVAGVAGRYTVFAQTVEGFDVIEKICELPVDSSTYEAVDEVIIEKITMTEYHSAE